MLSQREGDATPTHAGLPADQLHSLLSDGDILLFRGRRVGDGCIRCFTRSEYNHAAIVLTIDRELHILEATSLGVDVCPLEFYGAT